MLDRRLLIVSGKGGVGKSAVAAALARLAAASGRSVLAVAMTDGAGLASHLGVESLEHAPRSVAPNLAAMAVERARALEEYLQLQLPIPGKAPLGKITNLFGALVDTVPGVREIISMGKPIQDVWSGGNDLVIVDAPPLGQMFSYLSAPDTISRLVPSGAVKEQAARMRTTLADHSVTGLVLVTTLEELPTIETAEAVERVEASGLAAIAAVVANGVLVPLDLPDSVDLPPDERGAAARLHGRMVESQRRWAEVLPPLHRLPFIFGAESPLDVVEAMTREWRP